MNYISESDISTLYTSKYMALVNVGDRQTDRQTRKIHLPSTLMKILSLYKNTYIMNTCTLLLHLLYNSVYHL